MAGRTARTDALILSGGRGSRMGGADKPSSVVDGMTLLDRVVGATAFCTVTVVVGPHDEADRPTSPDVGPVIRTREDPPFGGPVSAMRAGTTAAAHHRGDPSASPDDVVLTLSADLPYVTGTELRRLVDELHRHRDLDAVFGLDSRGRVQYLVGAWRRAALERGVAAALARAAAAEPSGGRGPSIREALPTAVGTVALVGIDDVDTDDELDRARTASSSAALSTARFLIGRRLTPLDAVIAPLAEHIGAGLAGPLIAARPFPIFPTSAMDGYAVAGDGPWHLDDTVIVAGDTTRTEVGDGHAVRIATGAKVPGGTTVVRDEFVDIDAGTLTRSADAPIRDDARRVAEDWDVGTELAPAGSVVSPALVSAALSAGVTRAAVRRAPTVRLVLTGDEITAGTHAEGGGTTAGGDTAGGDDRPVDGLIRDTIGPVMPHYLRWCGFSDVDIVYCADTDDAFDDALGGGTVPDVVIVVGATGRGAADRLTDSLHRASGTTVVDGLACRPGGSTSVTVLRDGRVVLGVPGNPYAAVSTVCLLGPAITRALTGRPDPTVRTGMLTTPIPATAVTRVLPASHVAEDRWHCESSVRTAHLAALIGCDALAVITPDADPHGPVEIVSLPRT